MKVEFEYFEEPKRVNNETINFLRDKGKYFLCHIKEKNLTIMGIRFWRKKNVLYMFLYIHLLQYLHITIF